MRWLQETRSVAIADIRKPDDWDEVLAEERTKELAVDLKRTAGPVSLPVLHGGTMSIIAGTHRIAAMVIGGETHVTCRLFLGDPSEEEFVRTSDNAFPREDYDAWIDRRVKALAALIETQRADNGQVSRNPGRPKSPTGEAREIVAKERGVTPDAVRKNQERAEEKSKPRLRIEDIDGKPLITDSPKKEKPLTVLHRFVPSPRNGRAREGDGLLDKLRDVLLSLEVQYEKWDGARDAKMKTTPAGRVHGLASEAFRHAQACRDVVWQLVDTLERIEADLRKSNMPTQENERLPGEKPRRGLGGRAL